MKRECHEIKLKWSIGGDKGNLAAISGATRHLPIAAANVHGGEIAGALEAGKSVIYAWQRVNVVLGNSVKASVINAEAPGIVFLQKNEG